MLRFWYSCLHTPAYGKRFFIKLIAKVGVKNKPNKSINRSIIKFVPTIQDFLHPSSFDPHTQTVRFTWYNLILLYWPFIPINIQLGTHFRILYIYYYNGWLYLCLYNQSPLPWYNNNLLKRWTSITANLRRVFSWAHLL